jgi:chemotaxis protein methyltransferase CheR
MDAGSMKVDEEQLAAFRELLARRLGLAFGEDKNETLQNILHRGVAAGGHAHPRDFLRALELPASPVWDRVIETLTVGETSFFRQWDQFRALTETVIPLRIKARASEKCLYALSAGCASGEEPFSLAMHCSGQFPELDDWQVSLKGVDINPSSLAKAAKGLYSAWSLRDTAPDLRQRFFKPVGAEFQLDHKIRSRVVFERRNLAEPNSDLWLDGHYDFIFCRNVLMYHTRESASALVGRMARALVPGGFLFLGYACTLHGLSQDFQLCHTQDTFYYQSILGGPPAQTGAKSAAVTWVESIQRASERIASLSEQALGADRPGPVPAMSGALPADNDGAEALLLRAVQLADSGRCPEAETACALLLQEDALNAGAHFVLALCREQAGALAEAIQEDDRAIRLDASFAMPWLHSGLLARRSGDPQESRRRLESALVLLDREDEARLLLFGGGFSRKGLAQLCRGGLLSLDQA